MQRSTFHILFGIIALMWASLLHFLSLPLYVPAMVPLLLATGSAVAAYRWLTRRLTLQKAGTLREQWVPVVILAIGLAFLTKSSTQQLYIHGSNDALGMWDYYARFLSAANWRQLFEIRGYYHANHPMGLSSLTALVWRLTGRSDVWPEAISLACVLLIPVLLFTEVWKRHIPLAILLLILFVTDRSFHGYSFARIADLPLALCFLGAFITMHHFRNSGKDHLLFLCGSLLGCCLWIKNEGLLLVPVFLLFHIPQLSGGKRIRLMAGGLLPFVAVLIWYKAAYATPNDLLTGRTESLASMLTNRHAMGKIFLYFRETVHSQYYAIQAAFLLYLILCLIRKRMPDRSVLCLTGCLIGVLAVYLITPSDLDWQLGTSLARVLMELMPAFAYTLAMSFSTQASTRPEGFHQ